MHGLSKAEALRRLVELRNLIAERERKEKFKILQNRTIEAIVEASPKTLEELEAVKGMGEKKIARFGKQILAALYGENPPAGGEETAPVAQETPGEEKVMTVSRFLDRVNAVLAAERDVVVRGEISSIQVLPSGAYLALKDKEDESVLQCYIPPRTYHGLGIELGEGMEVKVGGVANVYKPKGRLSFLVYTLELAGEGSLKKAYELLKKKLEEEGLFARKRPLPEFVSKIGVVTSRTGAVIDDFRKNLTPLGLKLYLYDARVEGARAVEEVAAGIRWFNARMPDLDVLVIIRGGGSLEDLQAFNNEKVARAVFASQIPTICGIGHERDVPIASMAGDAQTSTPSIAAMLIARSWDRLREEAPLREQDLLHAFDAALEALEARTAESSQSLVRFFERLFHRAAAFEARLRAELVRIAARRSELGARSAELVRFALQRFERLFREQAQALDRFAAYLASNDPDRNLRLGYSILLSSSGKVVKGPEDISIGERITARIHRGEVDAKVERIRKHGTE